ncbi:aryl-sulfate sulfotransferase [Adhaeribacter radiodurans]|uniref:Aryl-sulfate sulfotransferase n=1 Tax=Adhaeribacter radiodurans TaxID=2745197 RepID=A0A7L7L5Q4_9BACT|nr:aryl-sulfate sulfotransferase [Adhaeribacter radiodurans]QMU28151.1 aryl-sulfate sulfotransferase [Adhaeribacter radiodurans]
MKKIHLLLLLLICLLVSSCGAEKKDATKEVTNKKTIAAKDRNMFGLGIPRGLTLNSEGLTEGYVMFAVPNSASVYLINRKGQVVHEWKGNYNVLGAYLGKDGSLVQNAADPDFPVFAGGGENGRIQKISWDNKLTWDFEYANEESHAHHDFAVMPNGNILAIAWEAKTLQEVLAAGRKPKLTPKAGLWPDKIVEIEPQGKHGGKIVWEWHIWDHLIQDYDSKKANYGNPADHPELLNFNTGDSIPPLISQDSLDVLIAMGKERRNNTPENMQSDVYHVNAVKYNPELNQIAFSSPNLCEIFIIDHSTTTKEAAGHTGGRWGKGGDFLYRWGNPLNYHRGDSTDQKLFHQHDVRWIEKGKPGTGNLTVFNNDIHNRDSLNYSAIYEIAPPVDKNGNYLLEKGKPYGPEKPVWTYIAPDSVSFWGSFISGAHRMNNGNTFIDEGPKGRYFEVTKEGKIVWQYLNPYRGEIRKPNGDPNPLMPMVFSGFRGTFIPADHPALVNRKLEPVNPQPTAFVMPSPPQSVKK